MAVSPFIKYIEIVGVVEDQVKPPMYMQHVQIVDVVDANWEPWEPVPGPDPWDELAWVSKSSTTGSTTLGSTLTGTPGVATGGAPPVSVVSQWQRSDTPDSFVGFSDWVEITDPVTYTTTIDDNGKYIRLATKAIDNDGVTYYGSGNNIGPMTPSAITVSQASKLSNGTFVNQPEYFGYESITVVPAVFGGGYGTLSNKYRLQKQEPDTGDTWVTVTDWVTSPPTVSLSSMAVGTKLRGQTRATDEASQTKVSNSPVSTVGTATTIGTITIDPSNAAVTTGDDTTLTVSWDGDVVGPMIIWSIRSGPGQIISPNNMSQQVEVKATGSAGDSIQVQVDLSDPSSSDAPKGAVAMLIIQ